MSDARTAILITLDPAHEGGFQKSYNDRANWNSGIVGVGTLIGTNGGITALDMPGADIEHLTIDQKVAYYLANYWKPLYNQINSQPIANKLFDMGVLFGIGTAVRALQIALDLVPDGIFGPMTLVHTNLASENTLLPTFKTELHTHARKVAAANPLEAPFLSDWSRRIDS